MTQHFPIIISGAGPAGLAMAALLAQEGLAVAVIAPPPARDDPRTTALMQPAMQLLKYIGVWPGTVAEISAPLRQLHLVDDTGHLVTAPRVEFAARELGLPEFGWNIPLAHLIPALHARALALGVSFITARCVSAKASADDVTIETDTGESFSARMLIAADGAQSPTRKALGFATETRKFDQTALVTNFDHSGPHECISTEWHKQDGPFTTVPLAGNRSALVWMARPQRIAQLTSMNAAALATEIQLQNHGSLGLVSNVTATHSFPMQVQRATLLGRSRCLLVGEAAHAFPPIGAQGLNLSLRDVATVADLVVGASDPGSDALCREYDALRRGDVLPRLEITGLLNFSLLSEFEGLHLARAAALAAVSKIAPLRRLALNQGISTNGTLPFAMRG